MGDLFGGSKPATQTSEFKMSPEQQQIFSMAMPYLKQFASSGIKLPTGSGVAGWDPTQLQAQNMAIGTALGGQSSLAGSGLGAAGYMLDPSIMLNPNNNTALQGYIQSATRPLTDDLLQRVLPEIRGEAITTGNFGSSGRGIAESGAVANTARQIGDTTSQIASNAYGQGLNAMGSTLAQLPNTMGAMLGPSSTLASVGDVRQGMSQTLLDEMRNRYMQEQTLPLDIGSQLLSIISGMPGGKTVATGTAPQASPFNQMAGLGLTLAGML